MINILPGDMNSVQRCQPDLESGEHGSYVLYIYLQI